VVVAGRGAVLAGAGPALAELAEACGALLTTSAVAHGLFTGDAFALGICGGFSSPLAAELLPQADVVLAVGASLNHWTTRHGALIGADATLIQVDADPGAIGLNRPAALGVVGDADAAARAITAALGGDGDGDSDGDGARGDGWRTPGTRDRIASGRWADQPAEAGAQPDPPGAPPTPDTIDPRELSAQLHRRLPAEKTVVLDSGHFTGWPAMYLDVPDPRAWVFVNGFQAVGLGLGAAIGAAVARPDRPTVAVLGDGGLFLALAELETAARIGARLLVVVYDDAAYGAEVHHFGPMGHDLDIVRFPDADLAALARAAGVAAITVREPADLDPLAAWLAAEAPGPLLVDAKVDPTIRADWLAEAFRAG
jgi:thiamine pyrophosphate-dependent acetolactate synthase large subunit-like protein